MKRSIGESIIFAGIVSFIFDNFADIAHISFAKHFPHAAGERPHNNPGLPIYKCSFQVYNKGVVLFAVTIVAQQDDTT